MKKKDMIVIVILCIIIGIGYFVYMMTQGEKEIVEVFYKDKAIATIDINVNKTYTYKGDYGNFSLEVKDQKYHAVNVDCPNHDCEKIGWVKEGESKNIICVPNQIYVTQSAKDDGVQ